VAIETTPLGFQKPDGNELARNGDNVISANAQKAQDLIAAAQTQITVKAAEAEAADSELAARIGVAEAAINAGAGGPGLSADPDHAGLYFFAGPTIAPDPVTPGLYTF
jgi:hypothetical protein